MAWVRLDDGFPQHPKLIQAGPLAQQLLVAALCHCNRYLTDGKIGMDELRALGRYDGLFTEGLRSLPGVPEPILVDDVIERLIAAGALEYEDGQLLVHDYGDYQLSRAQVEEQRERWRSSKRRQRAGVSGFQDRMSTRESLGRGSKENHLGADVHARARKVCPECEVGAGLHAAGCSLAASPEEAVA